ncbi:response regulator [Novosphingobium sp.]|uniref:response regulator n=1 Tax=Novosphingobium sp. TaxID=1874826 RepID=UPI002B45B83C|nr:response regulator [Novosphingobium sp.]HKR93103.1 response regulator [Novosphingobium sp.]
MTQHQNHLVVLVVDDDFMIRLDISETLREEGFEVLEASDAASALAALHDRIDIQLVCTDVQMPGDMDGIALALRVRAHYPHIGVMVLSGLSKCPDRLSGIPFLPKPFVRDKLLSLAWNELSAVNADANRAAARPSAPSGEELGDQRSKRADAKGQACSRPRRAQASRSSRAPSRSTSSR